MATLMANNDLLNSPIVNAERDSRDLRPLLEAVLDEKTIAAALNELAPERLREHGRMNWQNSSGYNDQALVDADISPYKRVIGDALLAQGGPAKHRSCRCSPGRQSDAETRPSRICAHRVTT